MNPVLVTRTRGEAVESFHRGTLCLVNEQGEVVFSVGDVNQISFTRSALKLFQVLPLIEQNGQREFGLTDEELAVMCGSHNAETEHQQAVRSILKKVGLSEANLQCGPQPPSDRKTRKELQESGQKPNHIHNNCSGKHAGFLALCQLNGWSVDDYLSPNHHAQKLMKTVTAEMHQLEEEDLVAGEDGCSAPIFAMSLYHQALGYKNLVSPKLFNADRAKACKKVVELVASYPFMIAGTNRYCTEMMEQLAPEVIGKTGADGVYSLAFPNLKMGACVKIDDGKMGPQYFVVQGLLKALGMFSPEKLKPLTHYLETPVKNWNRHDVGTQSILMDVFKDLPARLSNFS